MMAGVFTFLSTRPLHTWLSLLVLCVYWPVLFISTHLPAAMLVDIHANDKAMHYSAFLILTALFWYARYGLTRPHMAGKPLYIVLAIMLVYAAMDEGLQAFVPGRDANVLDFLADVGGIVTALALVVLLRTWVRRLVVYWLVLFALTHWPVQEGYFVRLPAFWMSFEPAFLVGAYWALTLLFWRTLCSEERFMMNSRIVSVCGFVLGFYVVFDETVSAMMGRGFLWTDFICGVSGVILGMICAAAAAMLYHRRVYRGYEH